MEVNCFQILLIDVTFNLEHVQKEVHNVLIKKMKTRIYAAPAIKGLISALFHFFNQYFVGIIINYLWDDKSIFSRQSQDEKSVRCENIDKPQRYVISNIVSQ